MYCLILFSVVKFDSDLPVVTEILLGADTMILIDLFKPLLLEKKKNNLFALVATSCLRNKKSLSRATPKILIES